MLVDLYLLRHRGAALKRSELGTPLRGHLVVGTWTLATSEGRRLVRQAELRGGSAPGAAQLVSLFGVEINRLDHEGLVLAGWADIEETERQAWWCRPVPAGAP